LEQKIRNRRGILAMLIVVLTAAALLTFPYAFNVTWSLPGAEADRTLTYRRGKLTWDTAADIDENGVIQLSMFRSQYENVNAEDGGKVLAPGTEKTTGIRLLNTVNGPIRYTAVLYRLDDTDVPISANLTGEDGPVTKYALPKGVTEDQVVEAIGGTVSRTSVKTMDIDWHWDYSVDEPTDEHDTGLGNKSALDQVHYGLYVVVEDYNNYDGPIPPKTGDNSNMLLWFILAVLSLIAVIYLAIGDRRREKAQKRHEN